MNYSDIYQFDRFLRPREVKNDDKLIMCLSHFVYLNVSQPAGFIHPQITESEPFQSKISGDY